MTAAWENNMAYVLQRSSRLDLFSQQLYTVKRHGCHGLGVKALSLWTELRCEGVFLVFLIEKNEGLFPHVVSSFFMCFSSRRIQNFNCLNVLLVKCRMIQFRLAVSLYFPADYCRL